MAEAENCRGECGGGLLVDITARETRRERESRGRSRLSVCETGVKIKQSSLITEGKLSIDMDFSTVFMREKVD